MELKEAIEILKEDLEHTKKANECGLATKGEFNKEIEAIEFILNHLAKQSILNHLTKQEKMINLMAEELKEWIEFLDEEGYCTRLSSMNNEEIKQYFEKKADESE